MIPLTITGSGLRPYIGQELSELMPVIISNYQEISGIN